MNAIAGALVAFGRFWYGFIVGDDWTLAVAVVAALALTRLLQVNGVVAWWLVPVMVIGGVGVSLSRSR